MSNGFVLRVIDGVDLGAAASVEYPLVVGREGDLVICDPTVSRKHVRVEPHGERLRVTDLGSSAGLVVNGSRQHTAEVVAGDVLALGSTLIRVLRLVRSADAATGPALIVRHRGADRVIAVRDGSTIGRDPDCEIQIDDRTVSRRHAVVRISAGAVDLEDLDSANGTRVGGRPLRGSVPLSDGVVIEVGSSPAQLTFSEGVASTGPIPVRVTVEGSTRSETLTVDAGPESTVAEVTAELAVFVDAPDEGLLVYRIEDGALLHPDDRWGATEVRPGDEFVLGTGDASAFNAATGGALPMRRRVTLNQLPRTVWPEPPFVVERIDPPESTSFKGRGIVWQIAGGMGAVAIGLTLALVNPSYAVFGLITGGIGIVSITASILGDQSRRRHRVSEYRRKLAELDVALGLARVRQATSLDTLSPSVDVLEGWVESSSPRIWERRPSDPDALVPTIGTGCRATRIELERSRGTDSPLAGELETICSGHTELERVPISGPGPSIGSFGLTGDQRRVSELVARIVVEAAILHPPNQLRIWVAATGPGWEWCRWLPHVDEGGSSRDPSGAAELLAAAGRAALESGPGTPTGDVLDLVVVPDFSQRLDVEALGPSQRGRLLFVVGGGDRRDLPSGLAVVLDVDHRGTGTVIGHYPEAPLGGIEVSGIEESRAERLAIALGRLGARSGRVAPSGLVELLGLGSAVAPDVIGSWRRPSTDRLTVAVGSDDSGAAVTVGFRRDGPHGMIAGTTGSGKSELLQTILVALALRHPPDRLTLFLVDFKGGSTFAPLATLPHVVGLVTDLEHDSTLATRALTALDAEIDRRKRVLEAARVPDVIAYERAADETWEPLPDLLVVIDEFALLVERQPEVRERLDTITTQGRSLGIHLLLATQSPSGVITHAIRTNTNLWICLRVVAESESMEILGTRDAARIPDGSPGRAIIRLGAGQDLKTFQAARIARPVSMDASPVRVTRLGGGGPPPPIGRGPETTELGLVVARIGCAAEELDLASGTPLWLPPLPADLRAADVVLADRPRDRLVAVVGLADLPRRHQQVPFTIDLSASGHALVSGIFGFGKTTTLCQIASDLALHVSPEDVHIYGIDGGSGSLGPIKEFPHVGDVVGANDVERLTRVVDRLARSVDTRRDQLATAGSGDFLRWRAAGGGHPWIVLLVDDYPAFREVAEQVETGRLLERFNSLLQNGPAVGVHVVVATAQAVDLRSREINLMPTRMVLRAADTADYALVDLRFTPNEAPKLQPGRMYTAGGVEVQVCRPDLDVASAVADRWASSDPARIARPVGRLPISVGRQELLAASDGVVLGVGGPDIEPVELRPDGASTVVLVAGPRQSGRSSTLAGLLGAIQPEPRHVLILAPRPGPMRELARPESWTCHSSISDVDEALAAFVSEVTPGSVLVIDDAETISAAPGVSPRLEQLLRTASETGISVLVAARVNDLPGLFDPWARYLMSLRRVVLLQPTVDDAFLFGAKLPAIPPPMVPGRGALIDGAQVTVLQVAFDEGGPDVRP